MAVYLCLLEPGPSGKNSSGADISRNRVAQTVKSLPAKRNTRVQSLGLEDLLEKEMATHSSTLAWKILWMEEPGSYSPWGHKESETTERLHFFTFHLGRQTSSLGKASLNF